MADDDIGSTLAVARGEAGRYHLVEMSKFIGGSAFAMARDIAEGYVTVTERTLKALTPSDVRKLMFEIDRHLRELRGSQLATDEMDVVRKRNRKISRLNTATMISRVYRLKTRRG